MFLRAASGPGVRLTESFKDSVSLAEKLGGEGLLNLLMNSLRLSIARRNERAGWALASLGGVDEASFDDGTEELSSCLWRR